MSFGRVVVLGACALFCIIGLAAGVKKFKDSKPFVETKVELAEKKPAEETDLPPDSGIDLNSFKDVDRIKDLFEVGSSTFPIIETITYKSHVPWMKGRMAWLADYARFYKTSSFFISRSLSGKKEYFRHKVANGNKFNVLKRESRVEFYLLVDLSLCKMWLYYLDLASNERCLLKTYNVSVGRALSENGNSLTPQGIFPIGNRFAVYKPGTKGVFQNKEIEMVQVFGTRWLPFFKSEPVGKRSSKGYGIQGCPWNSVAGSELKENTYCIGKQETDGCIRLAQDDLEELFAVVVSRPAKIEIVQHFQESHLPGIGVECPKK